MNPLRRPGGRQIIPRPDDWHPGPPAPWEGIADGSSWISVGDVLSGVARLGGDPAFEPLPGSKPSAVLMVLTEGDHGAEVLLTRRAWHLSHHKGEVSFPGGRMDPGETPEQAALREAHEEVMLDPALVTVHGQLQHLSTFVSQSYIVPVVATVDEWPALRPGTTEVDRIFSVPLAELTRSDTYRQEIWGRDRGVFTINFFELDDETVWGATGRMLAQLLCVSLGLPIPPSAH